VLGVPVVRPHLVGRPGGGELHAVVAQGGGFGDALFDLATVDRESRRLGPGGAVTRDIYISELRSARDGPTSTEQGSSPPHAERGGDWSARRGLPEPSKRIDHASHRGLSKDDNIGVERLLYDRVRDEAVVRGHALQRPDGPRSGRWIGGDERDARANLDRGRDHRSVDREDRDMSPRSDRFDAGGQARARHAHAMCPGPLGPRDNPSRRPAGPRPRRPSGPGLYRRSPTAIACAPSAACQGGRPPACHAALSRPAWRSGIMLPTILCREVAPVCAVGHSQMPAHFTARTFGIVSADGIQDGLV